MRKRSSTRTATRSGSRSRRGGSRIGRRQTTLRAQTPRSTAAGNRRRGTTSSRTRKGTTSAAHITTDHQAIQRWAEARGGWPATVARTARGESAGILRIDFPGFSGSGTLKPISWEDWFDKFEESGLAFLYQEKTADGKQSRFFKLIERQ